MRNSYQSLGDRVLCPMSAFVSLGNTGAYICHGSSYLVVLGFKPHLQGSLGTDGTRECYLLFSSNPGESCNIQLIITVNFPNCPSVYLLEEPMCAVKQ